MTDPLAAFPDKVAHPRSTHLERTHAGRDLAFEQVAVARQASATVIGDVAISAARDSPYLVVLRVVLCAQCRSNWLN